MRGLFQSQKVGLSTIPNNGITYQQWVLDESCERCYISKTCKAIELHQLALKDFPKDKEQQDIVITQ